MGRNSCIIPFLRDATKVPFKYLTNRYLPILHKKYRVNIFIQEKLVVALI